MVRPDLYFREPWRIFASKKLKPIWRFYPDKFFLKCIYRTHFGEKLDLKNPKKLTEKIQYLKLVQKNPEYAKMVDKYEAKKFVADKIGEEYVVPLLGVWNSFDEIDFDLLPEQFVLKCNHDSNSYVICKNKAEFDKVAARKRLTACLKRNFYYLGREWVYKTIKPLIIAEAYMEDSTYGELRDYKFFTFDGKPMFLHTVFNRQNKDEETYGDFFDMNYNHLEIRMGHNNAPVPPEKPVNFELMKKFAEKLAEGTKHLRVDFYEVDGKLYFGECTFYQDGGLIDIKPEKYNYILGSFINLD